MSAIFWFIKKCTWEDQARKTWPLYSGNTQWNTKTGAQGFLPDLHCLEGPCYLCLWVSSPVWSGAVPSGQSVRHCGIYPAFSYRKKEREVAQLCLTLWNPMSCSPPGSSVHVILQARVVKWVDISFSRGPSRPRDWTRVSRIIGRHFTVWAPRGVLSYGIDVRLVSSRFTSLIRSK